jgi:Raf kinase inhibitor-like YbhB/YbcL family protein
MKPHYYDRSRLLRAFSLKAFGAVILASFVFLAFFPIQRDNDNESSFLLPSFSLSASQSIGISTKRRSNNSPFTLSSPSFAHGEEMRHLFARTNMNNDVSPPLKWSNIPDGTASLVLIMEDRMTTPWVHWVLYNIPTTTSKLAANVGLPTSRRLPPGTIQGMNDWHEFGYGGPSPPIGTTQRYFFKLYALDIVLILDNKNNLQQQHQQEQPHQNAAATKTIVVQAMQGHVLGQAELMGTYNQQQKYNDFLE